MHELFHRFAGKTAHLVGSSWAFVLAMWLILAWLLTGPLFGYSDTWQLVINTATTIITFLMVFLIQNTQNRDTLSIQLKLDEIIFSVKGARNSMVNLEDLSDEDLDRLKKQFEELGGGQSAKDTKKKQEQKEGGKT